MKLILLLLALLGGRAVFISFDNLIEDEKFMCVLSRPAGRCDKTTYEFTDVGGIGKTIVFIYDSGACLYISNGESLCPELDATEDDCITGNVIKWLGAREKDCQLEYMGERPTSKYYRELQSFRVCIGYYGVSIGEKEAFDATLDKLIQKTL